MQHILLPPCNQCSVCLSVLFFIACLPSLCRRKAIRAINDPLYLCDLQYDSGGLGVVWSLYDPLHYLLYLYDPYTTLKIWVKTQLYPGPTITLANIYHIIAEKEYRYRNRACSCKHGWQSAAYFLKKSFFIRIFMATKFA